MTTALVTGTSSGIGLATSVSLGRRGHKVIATMRDLTRATELRKIAQAENLPISFEELDVNSDSSVDGLMGRLLSELGHIDVLVNNAGLGGGGSIEELPLGFFSRDHGDEFLRGAALHQGTDPKYANASQRLHRQRDIDRRADGHCTGGVVRGLQMGPGGGQ